MLKFIWPVVRIFQFISYIPAVITKVDNWPDYYRDFFTKKDMFSHWVIKIGDVKIKVRNKSVDRWSALENLILEKNRLKDIKDADLDTIIDLGANIGASMLNFHQYFPKARIIAVEPNESNNRLLKENIKLNGLEDQVEILEAAVSASDNKKVKLFINRNDAESSLVKKLEDEYQMVDNINFKELAKYIVGKTLLKMDIEGQEYDLMNYDHLDLLKRFEYMIVESHKISPEKSPSAIAGFFQRYDFNCVKKGRFFFISKK